MVIATYHAPAERVTDLGLRRTRLLGAGSGQFAGARVADCCRTYHGAPSERERIRAALGRGGERNRGRGVAALDPPCTGGARASGAVSSAATEGNGGSSTNTLPVLEGSPGRTFSLVPANTAFTQANVFVRPGERRRLAIATANVFVRSDARRSSQRTLDCSPGRTLRSLTRTLCVCWLA